jgi:hypothetical protein
MAAVKRGKTKGKWLNRDRHADANYIIGDGKGMKKGGMAKMMKSEKASKMGKVATAKPKMGSASKRADGVAKKGKTKGKMMADGGMAKMKSGGAC